MSAKCSQCPHQTPTKKSLLPRSQSSNSKDSLISHINHQPLSCLLNHGLVNLQQLACGCCTKSQMITSKREVEWKSWNDSSEDGRSYFLWQDLHWIKFTIKPLVNVAKIRVGCLKALAEFCQQLQGFPSLFVQPPCAFCGDYFFPSRMRWKLIFFFATSASFPPSPPFIPPLIWTHLQQATRPKLNPPKWVSCATTHGC